MAEFFEQLNSNDPRIVEEARQRFGEQFSTVKEPWLVNGLYDHYMATNSVRVLELLINVRESHHDYLFNKLNDSLVRGTNETKFNALILLGHVVRKHPTWLYKITEKALFRELLKLLKTETDILLLLSALLLLIVLLPCIPSQMGPHLQDVFDIFSRLAAFNSSIPGRMGEDQLVHMQVGLYALLQRLYGMYPCNFLAYLRIHYQNKEASNIFKHTIKPMLQTVQMHPLLVTGTKDYELSRERWKEMNAHDVVVQCEQYSIGLRDRFAHDACWTGGSSFRSRSGTTTSTTLESLMVKNKKLDVEDDTFSPSQMISYIQTPPAMGKETPNAAILVAQLSHQHSGAGQSLISSTLQSQEGTSPPEAAIEATPETTPIKDMRLLVTQRHQQQSLAQATVARALNNFGNRRHSAGVGSPSTTPTHSQPSSPMRLGSKEALSAFNFAQTSSSAAYAGDHQLHHPPLHRSAFNQPINNKRDSLANQKLAKMMQDRSQMNDASSIIPPASPLRLIPSEPISTQMKRTESPLSQEDEEVQSIVKKSQVVKSIPLRQCDSVLQDHEHNPDCEQGSPCISGGLHMPNSQQVTAFKKNMKRLRHHSQCAAETVSTGSSPGSTDLSATNVTVRRANSCPDMKKNTSTAAAKDGVAKTLEERDEEAPETNGFEQQDVKKKKLTVDVLTQTELPYEHLFLSIFPAYETNDIKPSPAPSPAPFFQPDKFNYAPTYDVLDKYIDCAVQCQTAGGDGKDTVRSLKEQLALVNQQLMFERARRETHATKNRTLFTDVTKIKVLEEHNSALSDIVKLLDKEIASLKEIVDKYRQEKNASNKDQTEKMLYWQELYSALAKDFSTASETIEDLKEQLALERGKLEDINSKWQKAESSLVNAEAEAKVFREQVLAGERGRLELEQVNRELLLAGETIVRYRERFAELSARCIIHTEREYTEIYQHELKALHQQLDLKTTALDVCRARIADLDASIQQHDKNLKAQKKLLNDAKEECNEKLKVVEQKYQSQLTINRALEVKILELYQQDISSRPGLHSPDTSSCHEVNASTERTTGMSPHSSPLSASLTSSEGSMAFMHSDIKNLQAIVDQKEPNAMKSSATENDLMDACLNSSSQTQTASTSKQND